MKEALKFILEHLIPGLPEHQVAEAKKHLDAVSAEKPEAASGK